MGLKYLSVTLFSMAESSQRLTPSHLNITSSGYVSKASLLSVDSDLVFLLFDCVPFNLLLYLRRSVCSFLRAFLYIVSWNESAAERVSWFLLSVYSILENSCRPFPYMVVVISTGWHLVGGLSFSSGPFAIVFPLIKKA